MENKHPRFGNTPSNHNKNLRRQFELRKILRWSLTVIIVYVLIKKKDIILAETDTRAIE
ncbi:MAG: hypothetical protein WCF01_09340 [Nitrososphaeraceae archaeon]